MASPRALVTGVTGQDGSFLAELLISKGYEVFGLVRPGSWERQHCASHLGGKVVVIEGDLAVRADLDAAVSRANPTEIYNLASQSRPSESWSKSTETLAINALGTLHLLEAARDGKPDARFYHASSSEMFGASASYPQNEATPFDPSNPYAAAKAYAHQLAQLYRRRYDMFISCGILFNHESERRPLHFLTQKVAYGAACAALGIERSSDLNEAGRPIVEQGHLALGNLDISRDWGYAPDFVRAMWQMLQQSEPDDFVVGTGELHTLRYLCEVAYGSVGKRWSDHVFSDPALVRPLETGVTLADSSKARSTLGWAPSVTFEEMIARMVQMQVQRLSSGNQS
jgi:GDPmannose 4,6-dehydratase